MNKQSSPGFVCFSTGLGQGLAYTGCLVNVGYYFRERTSLATSIGILACGVGNIVLPVLTQALIDAFYLDGAFLLIGSISFQACVCGMIMRPSKFECHAKQNRRQAKKRDAPKMPSAFMHFRHLISNRGFCIFLICSFNFTLGSSTLTLYLPNFFIMHGATPDAAALLVSYIGIGSVFSRFGLGFAATDSKIDAAILFAGVNILTSVLLLFVVHITETHLGKILFVLCYGCYNGGCWTLFNPITYDLVGVDHFASATGIVMFMCGAGYLIGAPVAGWIYQINNNYYSAFVFSGVAFFLTGVCGVLAVACRGQAQDVVHIMDMDTLQNTETDNTKEHDCELLPF